LRYSRLAKRGLAEWYLSEGQLERALALYHELANVEETETQFRLVGLAGEAVVYDLLDQPEEVTKRLPKILTRPDLREMLGNALHEKVRELAAKYGKSAGEE
jgi:hypothetical protein